MAFDRLIWRPTASEIKEQLPSEEGFRELLGQIILDRLETYGEFYDRLANERDLDIKLAQQQRSEHIPAVDPTYASVTIGDLTITSLIPGTYGNTIQVEITSGSASNFEVPQLDPVTTDAQLSQTLELLYGTTQPRSNNPEIDALLVGSSNFLNSLDLNTKQTAESIIRDGWDRFRNARTGMDFDRNRGKYIEAFENFGVDSDTAAAGMQIYDDYNTSMNQAVENTTNITISREDIIERYNDIVPGAKFTLMDPGKIIKPEAQEAALAAQEEALSHAEELKLITDGNELEAAFNSVIAPVTAIYSNPDNYEPQEVTVFSELISESWSGTSRPPDGTYILSGGVDGSSARSGLVNIKPETSYKLYLDSNRTFTLAQLKTIVSTTKREAEAWLNQPS